MAWFHSMSSQKAHPPILPPPPHPAPVCLKIVHLWEERRRIYALVPAPHCSVSFLFRMDFFTKPASLALFSKIVLFSMILLFKIKIVEKEILRIHFHGDFLFECDLKGKIGFHNIHTRCSSELLCLTIINRIRLTAYLFSS